MLDVMCDTERQLVHDIADKVQYWMLYGDVQLQTVAVKLCCNLSLVESQRPAIAETGILDSLFRKSVSIFLTHYSEDVVIIIIKLISIVHHAR